jgi:protein-S-isoprenylcysteine O-methyltransferase Ste14
VIGLFLRKPAAVIGVAGMVVIAFLIIKVQVEEKFLLLRYPDYAGYQHKSWGIIPWPHG